MTWDTVILIGYGVLVGGCGGFTLGVTLGLLALRQFKAEIAGLLATLADVYAG